MNWQKCKWSKANGFHPPNRWDLSLAPSAVPGCTATNGEGAITSPTVFPAFSCGSTASFLLANEDHPPPSGLQDRGHFNTMLGISGYLQHRWGKRHSDRSRCDIEFHFDGMKNLLDCNRLNVHGEKTMKSLLNNVVMYARIHLTRIPAWNFLYRTGQDCKWRVGNLYRRLSPGL